MLVLVVCLEEAGRVDVAARVLVVMMLDALILNLIVKRCCTVVSTFA